MSEDNKNKTESTANRKKWVSDKTQIVTVELDRKNTKNSKSDK